MHLNEQSINSLVQYNNGNNTFFNLDENTSIKMNAHIDSCIVCKKRYDKSEEHFFEIGNTLLQKNNSQRKLWLSVAACFLICISFLVTPSKLNKDQFVKLGDFNLIIHRSNTDSTINNKLEIEFINQLTFYLNEEQYDNVISICESKLLTKNNKHYAIALALKGQLEDDISLIEKSIESLEDPNYKIIRDRLRLIVETN